MSTCEHQSLCFDASRQAERVGYSQPTAQKRLAATQPSGRVPIKPNTSAKSRKAKPSNDTIVELPVNSTFPAPLVLPGDELAWDPQYPPQSLRSWIREKDRNPVTSERRTVYVVPPPGVDNSAAFLRSWAQPADSKTRVAPPSTRDVYAYLEAFYHCLEVKLLPTPNMKFSAWDKKSRKKQPEAQEVQPLGLETVSEAIRIRTRRSQDGIFSGQLNLNDLLDAAISILPEDAYALLMLVDHDLYEDDDDDFCCGRAYGGSRVAVVSTARYHPLLDIKQEVEREHAWPASHCREYMNRCCDELLAKPLKKKQRKAAALDDANDADRAKMAMGAALAAYSSQRATLGREVPSASLSALWLDRVCKTASHELGHCFGIDHCVYYACIMQGTAGLSEDARQPPYLCPVDMAKLLRATGTTERDWDEAMLKFCGKSGKEDGMFAAFGAWLRVRLSELEVL